MVYESYLSEALVQRKRPGADQCVKHTVACLKEGHLFVSYGMDTGNESSWNREGEGGCSSQATGVPRPEPQSLAAMIGATEGKVHSSKVQNDDGLFRQRGGRGFAGCPRQCVVPRGRPPRGPLQQGW